MDDLAGLADAAAESLGVEATDDSFSGDPDDAAGEDLGLGDLGGSVNLLGESWPVTVQLIEQTPSG